MVVQLNQNVEADGVSSEITLLRLFQAIENQDKVVTWRQQQYFSPIYSAAWYKTQIILQTKKLLYAAWAMEILAFLFVPSVILLAIFVYFLPFLHRFIIRRQPKNPIVRCDFAQREISFWENGQRTKTIAWGKPSSIMVRHSAILFRQNSLISICVVDKDAGEHLILQMETATVSGKANSPMLAQVNQLLENWAKRLDLPLFRHV